MHGAEGGNKKPRANSRQERLMEMIEKGEDREAPQIEWAKTEKTRNQERQKDRKRREKEKGERAGSSGRE